MGRNCRVNHLTLFGDRDVYQPCFSRTFAQQPIAESRSGQVQQAHRQYTTRLHTGTDGGTRSRRNARSNRTGSQ